MLGLAANKVDLFEQEQVEEQEGRKFAEDIGAYFKYTSAKINTGVDELFKELGKNYLKTLPKFQNKPEKKLVDKITDINVKQTKKKCC